MTKKKNKKKDHDKLHEEGWSGMGGSLQGTLGGPDHGIAEDEVHQRDWNREKTDPDESVPGKTKKEKPSVGNNQELRNELTRDKLPPDESKPVKESE